MKSKSFFRIPSVEWYGLLDSINPTSRFFNFHPFEQFFFVEFYTENLKQTASTVDFYSVKIAFIIFIIIEKLDMMGAFQRNVRNNLFLNKCIVF